MNEHDYIAINYLHKKLIEIIFEQELPPEVADAVLKVYKEAIQGWWDESDI